MHASDSIGFKCMTRKRKLTKNDLLRPITVGDLGTFTEEVILLGVERIVEEKLDGLQADMKSGFADLKEGMKDVHNSIKVLAGEIAVREEDRLHRISQCKGPRTAARRHTTDRTDLDIVR